MYLISELCPIQLLLIHVLTVMMEQMMPTNIYSFYLNHSSLLIISLTLDVCFAFLTILKITSPTLNGARSECSWDNQQRLLLINFTI